MAQLLQTNPSVVSIGASQFLADIPVASNGQLPAQAVAFAGSGRLVKQILQYEGGFLNVMTIEHPSTIAYVSSCQQNNCMIYVSPQVACLGFTPEAWLGKPDSRLQQVHEEDLARVEKAMLQSRSTGGKLSCHYRLHDSAGKVRWFHDEASVMCDESGDPLFIMGAMRDITEMKVMEAELNEHRYYLERKVEQRTEQLVRRITLLETCNTTLCDKLAQARRDVAALHKQLASALSGAKSDDCPRQLAGISGGMQKRYESDAKVSWLKPYIDLSATNTAN